MSQCVCVQGANERTTTIENKKWELCNRNRLNSDGEKSIVLNVVAVPHTHTYINTDTKTSATEQTKRKRKKETHTLDFISWGHGVNRTTRLIGWQFFSRDAFWLKRARVQKRNTK